VAKGHGHPLVVFELSFLEFLKGHSFRKDIRVVPCANQQVTIEMEVEGLWVVTCSSQLENQLEHQDSHEGWICFHLYAWSGNESLPYISLLGFIHILESSLLSGLPMFPTIVLNGSPSSSQVLPNCATTAPSWKSF